MKDSSKTGFTLIELLVVISVISLLTSVVFSQVHSAREKARDAKRERDMRTIRQALELHYNEHGKYPTGVNNNGINEIKTTVGESRCKHGGSYGDLGNKLSDHMAATPTPPGTHRDDCYYYFNDRYDSPNDSILFYRPEDKSSLDSNECPPGEDKYFCMRVE